jgi:hypothetical protein
MAALRNSLKASDKQGDAAPAERRRPAPNAPAFEPGGMDDDIPF